MNLQTIEAVRNRVSPSGLKLLVVVLTMLWHPPSSLADSASAPPATRAKQSPEATALLVVRSDAAGVDPRLARELDVVLARTLARSGKFAVRFSSTPYADLKLAAGCGEREVDCLRSMAQSSGSEWLLVRELALDKHATVHLTLRAHDGREGAISRSASAPVSRKGASMPKQVVPSLVARIYSSPVRPKVSSLASELPEPEAERAPELARHEPPRAPASSVRQVDTTENKHDLRRVLGWASVAGGGAMMLTGTVFAALSARDEHDYGNQEIRGPSDVDHAEALLERSEREAKIANGLLIGGAGLAAVGTGLLLWQHFSHRDQEPGSLRWAAVPVPGGATLHVGGDTLWRRRR